MIRKPMLMLAATAALITLGGGVALAGGTPAPAPAPATATAPRAVFMQAGATVYAKRDGTEVRQGTGRTDPVVESLKQGAPMSIIRVDGTRFHVKLASGRSGYVARLNVSEAKPRTDTDDGLFSIKDDQAAANRTNVSSIRGLQPLSKDMADKGEVTPEAVTALDQMKQTSFAITAQEVDEFAAEKGIKPL